MLLGCYQTIVKLSISRKIRRMKTITDKKIIEEVLNRGVVVEILPSKEALIKFLMSGKRMKIYVGADPTSDSLHLSHAKNYMLLEEFRSLGHEVIILVGDFTAQIGDPSGEGTARRALTEAQVKKNVKAWISQIKPLLNFNDKNNPPRIVYNNTWLSKLSFKDVVELASHFTVQQLMKRDMFEKRLKENVPIYVHEFLYPLMQGYDSVELGVDAELCGTDQIFNALVGRTLLRQKKGKEKFVVAVNLMENPKTHELMSKSKGTGVFLSSTPEEMYGALMAQPDEMTEVFFTNLTRISFDQKEVIFALGPKEAKVRVAYEVVKRIYGEKYAVKAKEHFHKVFSKKEVPTDMPTIGLDEDEINIINLLLLAGVPSKTEARRLITQKAVDVGSSAVLDQNESITITEPVVLKVGKKRFFRVVRL